MAYPGYIVPLAVFSICLSKPLHCWEYFPLTGSYYHISSSKFWYTEAGCACRRMGSHLVKIETKLELAFLDNLLQKEFINQSLWVGGSDLKKDGTFVWDDGSAIMQSLWTQGEPNNRDQEHIIQIVQAYWKGNTNFTLNDASDHDTYFICEKTRGATALTRTWRAVSRDLIHWDNVVLNLTDVTTLMECFLLCATNCGCYSVVFNARSRRCYLNDAYLDRFEGAATVCEGCVHYE